MKQTIKSISFLLGILLSISSTNAQILSIQAKVDTNIILIGDQVKLYLEVNQPKSFQINFPFLNDTIINKIEVLEDLGRDTILSDDLNQILIKQKYLITSFDSGIYVFPPFEFTFQSYIDSTIDTIATTPMYFGVMTMALDTANPNAISDIKLPYKAPITFKEILPYALFGYFILFIISFLVFYFEKRKKNEPVFVRRQKPKEPPHVIAYRNLDQLKNDKLWQKNLIKKYHSELSGIVRIYIEDRFHIRAMEQTSDEILESFRQTKLIDSILFENLEKMLQLADLVKFAKAIPLADENEQSFKNAYILIDKTKQVFISPDEKNVKEIKKLDESDAKVLVENNEQNLHDS